MKHAWAERLKRIRTELGLSGEAFGKPMGYSKAQISKLESGLQKEPSREFLDTLERCHRVSQSWLTEGRDPQFVSQETLSELATHTLHDAATVPYRSARSVSLELLRALESASAAATIAGRTDFSRVLLDMIDEIKPATLSSPAPESLDQEDPHAGQ